MEKILNIIQTHKKKFYVILILLVLLIILLIVNSINNKDNKYKEVSNRNYVYTLMSNDENKLPYININGNKIDNINDELYEDYYMVIQNENNKFNYEYYLDDNILYLFITIEEYNKNDILNPRYISYYINIENGKILSLDEILEKHDLDIDKVTSKIDDKLNSSYIEEVELGYVEKGFCDFECYKDIHEINPINKRIMLFYDGKELKAYLNYNVETIYYTDDNPVEFPHIFDL